MLLTVIAAASAFTSADVARGRTVAGRRAVTTMQAARGAGAAVRGALVAVSVVPDTVRVGDPFVVRVRVRAPKNATIRFPAVPDSGDAIEALDPRSIEEGDDPTVLDRTAVYRLVAWDVGTHHPKLEGVAVASGGTEQLYPIRGAGVVVTSLLPADSADRIPKDAREPIPPASIWWRYALVGVLLLAGGLWCTWRRVRRRRRSVVPAPAPEAYAAATSAFGVLDTLGLAELGEPGRHVIAHVDVLRRFVARRVPAAPESLTPLEFVRTLAASDLELPVPRVHALLARDAEVRYAQAGVIAADATVLAKESRALVGEIQRVIEARARAEERRRVRARRSRKPS